MTTEEKSKQIIESAAQTFMKYGIRSVTMDDIAKHAGISKKTLYQVVSDKNELVSQVMDLMLKEDIDCFKDISNTHENAIEQVGEIFRQAILRLGNVHPSVHFDLEKYYPEAWHKLNNHKNNSMFNMVKENLELGIKQGLYRDNLNVDVITKLYVAKMDMIFDGEIFPVNQYQFSDVFKELFRYHIRGIASDKGRKYLKELISKGEISLY